MSDASDVWSSLTSSIVISFLRVSYPIHILHTMFYVDILTLFVKKLNAQAQDPTICTSTSRKSEFLKNIKSVHMEMWKLTAEINDFFGMNLLFVMINSFIYNLYQLYWLFLAVELKWGLLAVVGNCIKLNLVVDIDPF